MDAKTLSTLRSAMQLTQSDMAKRLGICLRLYSDYEHGKKPVMQLVQWRVEQLQAGIGNS